MPYVARPSAAIVLSTWWRHQMETFSALLALCAGNSPVTGEFPAQGPVTRSFDVFFDIRLNKRLSKQSWGWWFETPSRPFWRDISDIVLRTLVFRKRDFNPFQCREIPGNEKPIILFLIKRVKIAIMRNSNWHQHCRWCAYMHPNRFKTLKSNTLQILLL